MTETWRVASLTKDSPAHLITYDTGVVRVTACNWPLRAVGLTMTREEMLATQRFACSCCLRAAVKL